MIISLSTSLLNSSQSLSYNIKQRRTCRDFSNKSLTLEQLSQLLLAGQSLDADAQRTAPSAGAQYPMDIYVVAGDIVGVPTGLYQYQMESLELHLVDDNDLRQALCDAALEEQPWVNDAAMIIVLAANFSAMQEHFQKQPPCGERGDRYIYIESGAIAQNIHLQATDINLGMVLVGGFEDDKIVEALSLPDNIKPTALLCVGVKK